MESKQQRDLSANLLARLTLSVKLTSATSSYSNEAEFLLSEAGQERLAEAMYQSILHVEKTTI